MLAWTNDKNDKRHIRKSVFLLQDYVLGIRAPVLSRHTF
jgi:hypothetical protein